MSRCPSCQAFISLKPFIELRTDYVFCRSCGSSLHVPSVFDVALVAGTRRAETPQEVQGVALQNGLKGNALSNLLPNGKNRKQTFKTPCPNLSLFGGDL